MGGTSSVSSRGTTATEANAIGTNHLNVVEAAHGATGIDRSGRVSATSASGDGGVSGRSTGDHHQAAAAAAATAALHFEAMASGESPRDPACESNRGAGAEFAGPVSMDDPPQLPSAPSILSAKLQAELAENFHFVTIPLMILATVAVGFMLVYLKDVLVPFVIGVFLV